MMRSRRSLFASTFLFSLFTLTACSSNDGGAGSGDSLDSGVGSPLDSSTNEAAFDVPGGNDVALDVTTDGNVGELGPDGSCGGTTIDATARDVALLLVVDASGSMAQTPTGFSMTKWDAIKSALSTSLDKVKEKMSLGLEVFPHDPTGAIANPCSGNCCAMPTDSAAVEVAVGPGTSTLSSIVSTVDGTTPGGATPTAAALQAALAYFTGPGKDVKGDHYVVLATDGGPNCDASLTCDADHCTRNLDGACAAGTNCCDPTSGGSRIDCLDDAAVVSALDALSAAGVKTFVVGIPGSEAYATYLDEFATAGGMTNPAAPPKYFAVSASGDVGGLSAVFDTITGELITSCRLQLSSTPEDLTKLNVYVDGTLIPQSGPDGWSIDTSTSPPTIVLEGTTCADIETKGAKVVDIQYGCPTIK